jgi:hypothetical protein
MKKAVIFVLIISLVTVSLYSTGLAQDYLSGMTQDREKWVREDPIGQGWSAMDLVFARPIGFVAAVLGAGIFIVSLPFTGTVDIVSKASGAPAHAISDSAQMFMLAPLKFSFVREFPDGDI